MKTSGATSQGARVPLPPSRRATRRGGSALALALALALVFGACGGKSTFNQPAQPGIVNVPSSIAADCSTPVDRELNAFLASVPDGSTVRFYPKGCYGIDQSIWIKDRNRLTLDGNGATLKIITSNHNTQLLRSNIRIARGTDTTLENLTIVGACRPGGCQNGTPPPPSDGYGQHGVSLESTASPTLENLHIHDVLSDGVEAEGTLDLKSGWSGKPTTNLVIRDSHIERAGRMLVGITDLDGATIERNVIENGPEAGVDVEVDTVGFLGRHVMIRNNTFKNIHSDVLSNGGIGSDPLVGDITFQDNTLLGPATNCAEGEIYLRSPGPETPTLYRSGFTITGNRFDVIGPFLHAERIKNLQIRDNRTTYREVGCGQKGALELFDTHSGTISGNDFTGYQKGVLFADKSTSGVSGP